MRLEFQIIAAIVLDAVIGDPRGFPHPVRFFGRLAAFLEVPTRRMLPERAAGILTVIVVVSVAGGASAGLLAIANGIHIVIADLVSIGILYTSFAAGDLSGHARNVMKALLRNDLKEARRRAGLMVGRDTEALDEKGVTRATVESVAENTVDGVTGPIFYAFLFGPVGAMIYKAVNTLDSTFGYRNERYLRFGWASARLDDVVNWLPARISVCLMPAAAWLTRNRAAASWRMMRRDGKKHASPNAGLMEAAVAGALGIQLGGENRYQGVRVAGYTLGDPQEPITPVHVRKAIQIMWVASLLFAGVLLGVVFLTSWQGRIR